MQVPVGRIGCGLACCRSFCRDRRAESSSQKTRRQSVPGVFVSQQRGSSIRSLLSTGVDRAYHLHPRARCCTPFRFFVLLPRRKCGHSWRHPTNASASVWLGVRQARDQLRSNASGSLSSNTLLRMKEEILMPSTPLISAFLCTEAKRSRSLFFVDYELAAFADGVQPCESQMRTASAARGSVIGSSRAIG